MASSQEVRIHTVGRRKSSTCRVYLTQGTGVVLVNRNPMNSYFDTINQQYAVVEPLKALEVEKDFDVLCFPSGGGKRAQADATRLAVARALKKYESDFNPPVVAEESADESEVSVPMGAWHFKLKRCGMLTCDSRKVERKKFGLRGARKRVQYSKR